MRFLKSFVLALALAPALGAVPAFAAAPVRLSLLGLGAFAPAACPLVLPSAEAGRSAALLIVPAAAVPVLPPSASPVLIPTSGRGAVLRSLEPAPAPAADGSAAVEARYARFFDGHAPQPGDDGLPVFPIPIYDARTPQRLPLQLDVTRRAVEGALPALRESVSRGEWNGPGTVLDGSCCGDAAPKLGVLLRGLGVPARLVRAEFHYYLILDLPEGQVIVDPTIRQFFGKTGAPRGVPTVFVGTIPELHALFARYAAAKTTRYDPWRIYFRESALSEDKLRRLDAEVRGGSAAAHEPLRRFLGVPSARPSETSRLIVP